MRSRVCSSIAIARSPGSPSRPPSRIAAAISRAVPKWLGGASSTLNATSGGRAATSVTPALGCGRRGPKSGVNSPARDARREVRDAAAADLGARAPAGEDAVEEHGQPQLAREQFGGHQRLGARRAALGLAHVHERNHVDRPDMRMLAAIGPQIDPLHRLPGARKQRRRQRALSARQAEDRAVVIGVLVAVQQPRARLESGADRIERHQVTPLRDVRNGEQRRRHAPDDTVRTVGLARGPERGAVRPADGKVPVPAGVAQSVRAAES